MKAVRKDKSDYGDARHAPLRLLDKILYKTAGYSLQIHHNNRTGKMGKSVEVLRLCRVYLHDDNKWRPVRVPVPPIFSYFKTQDEKRKSTGICF